jgi:hypothetical protein
MKSLYEYFLIILSLGIFIANLVILFSFFRIKRSLIDSFLSKDALYHKIKSRIKILITTTLIAGFAISFLIWNMHDKKIQYVEKYITREKPPLVVDLPIKPTPSVTKIKSTKDGHKLQSPENTTVVSVENNSGSYVDPLNFDPRRRFESFSVQPKVIAKPLFVKNDEYVLPAVYMLNDDIDLNYIQKQLYKILYDTSITVGYPKFYVDTHLLLGAEILDPFHPKESLVTVTRLWNTDIRLGISQEFKNNIVAFVSVRVDDSPQTNNFNLYEAGIKKKHDWGTLWFGQKRMQSGNESFYLNDAFDRSFWDQGLIFDYLMRGIGTVIDFGIGETEVFIGSDPSSYFIGGGKYSLRPFSGFNAEASGLYIARDREFSAFGTELGLEFKESYKHFFGYQVIGYKKFDQEPSPLRMLTIFAEARYMPDDKWNFGAAYYFRRLKDLWHVQDELRMSADLRYKVGDYFTPVLQTELFRSAGFTEIHLGFAAYLQFFKSFGIIPRVRYIITQFGPKIGFIAVEGKFYFGRKE